MHKLNQAGAINYALAQLEKRLPPKLTYHNLWHTRDDVMPTCIQFARQANVSEADQCLLLVAAAFHDIGFIEAYTDHEIISARIAAQVLPGFEFSAHQIEQIVGMILATRLPQTPHNLLEEIIADADLSIVGRPDFLLRNICLREEQENYGQQTTNKLWYQAQLVFLQNHSYFTAVARKSQNSGKQQNISLITEILASMA